MLRFSKNNWFTMSEDETEQCKQPCPRCQRGEWRGRSLTQHLTHCNGPSLYSMFPVGQDEYKRKVDEYETATPTNNQRLKHLDGQARRAHDSGTVRTHDFLSTMPSLNHLASNYASNDISYTFEYEHNDDISEEENNTHEATTEPSPHSQTIDTNQFRRYLSLPPNLVYQLHMQDILSGHRNVDLSLFDEINQCVQLHATEHKVDFGSCKMYSRKELVTIMTELYNLHGMKPTMNRVKLNDNSVAVVPTFDIKTMLLSILNDNTRMRPENIAPNYNLFTGKPTKPVTKLDEIHTGWAWEKARSHYCGDDTDVLPLGLICFYDKTHSDVFGSLACSPFIAIPHFFNERWVV